MEPQQTNWIVNNDQFGSSCIQIHAAVPTSVPEIHTADVRQREHTANVPLSLLKRMQKYFPVQVFLRVAYLDFYATDLHGTRTNQLEIQ